MGWWPITFPGFADPPYGEDWHVDGVFLHFINSPKLAVLNLFCFSTVDPGGGGTLLVEGSHRLAAKILWEAYPAGLEPSELGAGICRVWDASSWPGVVEVTADEGDVVLGHPLLLHSSNPNYGDRVRVMAQPQFDMTEPKRTVGSDLSPVEVVLSWARAA
jgi:ectoine hydroxylase-related dioxygenase (phytanoyl-CoA dioxygenase family)